MQDEPNEPSLAPTHPDESKTALDDGEFYTTAEFHAVIQKQIAAAALDTLVASKMDWGTIEPFLRAARDICRGDFRRTGRIQIHGVTAEGDEWVDAEEA